MRMSEHVTMGSVKIQNTEKNQTEIFKMKGN